LTADYVNAMTEKTWLTYAEALKFVRGQSQSGSERLGEARLHVMTGGNCNADFLKPALDVAFEEDGTTASVVSCGYDSWIDQAMSPAGDVDAWVIWISTMGISNGGITRSKMDIDGMWMAFQTILQRGERVVAIMPETLDISIDGFSPFSKWNRAIRRDFLMAAPEELCIIDPDTLLLDSPYETRHNPTYWSVAKLPFHPDAATALGVESGRIISRSRRQKVKAIVVDLDNTLWGGVVGDLGAEGVYLDPNGNGRPYLQLQSLLKDLSDEGVPLAIVSKNNRDDALSPFRIRDEMLLKEDDFIAFVATWDNKYKAIEAISAELNIGMDTVCFLDDSMHERDEAKAFLPELIIPDLPENPELRPQMLVQSRLFLRPVIGAEDSKKVEYYRQERKRRESGRAVSDWETYLKSLEMRLIFHAISGSNIQRVASLIQKTNQFNLTTRRRELSEIKRLSEDPSWFTYCYSLEDKFGDSGIIGVILAEVSGPEMALDSWVMSCRVMGRRVEFGMAAHLFGWASGLEIQDITGTFVPTSKNLPVAGFLSDLGMETVSETDKETTYQGRNLVLPRHFTVLGESGTTENSDQVEVIV
jgi:FkbH-like protein